jgi:phosphopentomutase
VREQRPAGKVVCIILDGVGIGELPDADRYGDRGSDTLGNTARALGGLRLPNLQRLGLGSIAPIQGVPPARRPAANYGKMAQASRGKDSTTGHWELAGCLVEEEFPTYPGGFPAEVMGRFCEAAGVSGFLGNRAASGTAIIEELGDEHVRTGFPIVYTSADSVFQIAAHEGVISLERLYEICRATRERVCVGAHEVGRVIARPFVGTSGAYVRTTNRRDFSLEPFGPTVLDLLTGAGIQTVGIGKVDDLYARRGLGVMNHTRTNAEGIGAILEAAAGLREGFIIANLVDFDSLYGHRNDPEGFARCLEEFDLRLPAICETIREGDLLCITADHGNDPVTPSTDHSREYVPLLAMAPGGHAGVDLGTRSTFADLGQTVAGYFALQGPLAGRSFLAELGIPGRG